MKHLKNLLSDESGATAIEYGLIAALISIAAIVAYRNVGTALNDKFTTIDTELRTPAAGN